MAALSTGAILVFLIIFVALILFVVEPVPIEVTAIGIMVTLMILGDWTGVSPSEGLSGFSNTATITILAMMILSEGVRRTGLIQRLRKGVSSYTGSDEKKQLGATVGIVGPLSGVINNTAAVALLMPMVNDVAHENGTSPSKLLIPLSYASMFGGMLTLVGTSTNLIASSLSDEYLGQPFSMFEFTQLGAVVFVVGSVYLLTVGYRLAPSHVKPRSARETAEKEEYLTEVIVERGSPVVGSTVREVFEEFGLEAEVPQLIRDGTYVRNPPLSTEIGSSDVYTVRIPDENLRSLLEIEGVELVPEVTSEADLDVLAPESTLVEIVLTAGSDLVGKTIDSARFSQKYQARVLAIRRGGEVTHERLTDFTLRPGDLLLIESDPDAVDRLADEPDIIVAGELSLQRFRGSKLPIAIGTVLGVIAVAALGLLPIVVSALAGVVVMISSGVLKPAEAYDSVQWDVIFLLAGVIPLGRAMRETGGAEFLGSMVVSTADFLPMIAVLGLFYVVTATMTNLISNQASVVLLVPVAVDAAESLGANPFAFVLAVTFGASTAFMTPVGYQTNLFVYGPGKYEFVDYVRVGAPLQVILAVVTTVGIAFFWGL